MDLEEKEPVTTLNGIKPVTTFNSTLSTSATISWEHFSALSKLIKSVAFCLRFGKRRTVLTQVGEQMKVMLALFWLTQLESFPKDYNCLKANRPTSQKSRLIKIAPFLDGIGIMRLKLKGRFLHANF